MDRADVSTTWTKLGGAVAPQCSGAAQQAVLVVGSDGGGEIYIDDVSFSASPSLMGPIPGTARREVQ
jgi:hypothetical protein